MPKNNMKGIDYMTDNELSIILKAMMPSLANLNAIIKETNAYLQGKITTQVVIGASPATRQNLTALETQLNTLSRAATQTSANVNTAEQNMIRNEQRNLLHREQMYGTHTSNIGNIFTHHMKSMAIMGAVFGSLELAKEGLVDFESGMAGVKQVLEETYEEMHKTLGPEEMARIGEGFSIIAQRWGESSQEILEAAKSWGRQYKDVQTIQNLVNNSVLLSVVDSVPLEQSVRSLEAVLNQWQMIAKTAEEANQYSLMVVDSWSALAHKQMATATDLSAANAKMGAISAQMGLDFAHAQGLITSSLRATGFKGAEIGNMWKSVLSSIHSDKAIEELDKLGVAVKNLKGNFRPVQDVLLDLMIAMKGTEVNQEHLLLAVAGGKFQWAKLAASLGDVETYLSATATSIASTGKAAEYMHAQMDTISRKAGQLHQSLIALVAAGGNSGLNGVIKGIIDNLRYFIDGLNNGGMKVVAFGSATYLAVKAIDNISIAIKTATAAGKAWNVTTAISQALIGNWAAIAGAAVVIGAVGLTMALGKQADAEKELIEVNKNKIEQQKAMITQYDNEIAYVEELEQTRDKLKKSMDGMSDADERKIRLNDILSNSEEALGQVIGEEALGHLKAAGFTQQAFQLVVESLKDKQSAEKIAWQNTSKLVSDATNNLRKNILTQIEQIGKVTEAYGILGKLQENGLWVEKELIYARYELSPTPDNARAFDEVEARISKFYKNQANNRIGELTAQLSTLGGVVSDFTIPDIPTSDFKSIVSDDDEGGSKKSKLSTEKPSHQDTTDALINLFNAQVNLTKAKNDTLKKQIEETKGLNDYNNQITLTNQLIQGQQTEFKELNEARDKINTQKDSVMATNASQFGDINRWFDNENNASLNYIEEFNASSVEVQKQMETTFSTMGKLRKSWVSNKNEVDALTSSQKELAKSLTTLQSSLADDAISSLKKYYETQKKLADDAFEESTKLEESKHNQIMDNLDEELSKQEQVINDQIKALDKLASAEDYNKNLGEKQTEAQSLQTQINSISLDTSPEGKAKKEELQKQLDALNSDISDMQSDHDRDLIKQSLQDQLDAISKEFEARKKSENDSYEATKKRLEDEKQLVDDNFDARNADETYWAGVRQAIIDGNITSINDALTKFSDGFTKDLSTKAGEIDSAFKKIINTINQIKSAASSVSANVNISGGDTSGLTQGATGGKLASWGTQGKAMIVHQDELLVNAPDSKNILKALNRNDALFKNLDLSNLLQNTSINNSIAYNIPKIDYSKISPRIETNISVPTNVTFNVTANNGEMSRKDLEKASSYISAKVIKDLKGKGR